MENNNINTQPEKYHILAVDDNRMNLILIKKILTESYNVSTVTSGKAAFEHLENNTADMILLDLRMPEMDGFQFLEIIKADEKLKNIPIICLTAVDDHDAELRCFQLGALDFITKPFVAEIMCSRIERILELEQLRKSLANRLDEKIKEVSDIKSKSYQDALTGLWNRAYTEEKVDEMLKRALRARCL